MKDIDTLLDGLSAQRRLMESRALLGLPNRREDFDELYLLDREIRAALPTLAPHHSPAEHDRAAERIAREIGGGE